MSYPGERFLEAEQKSGGIQKPVLQKASIGRTGNAYAQNYYLDYNILLAVIQIS
jgi:hypothetical protein